MKRILLSILFIGVSLHAEMPAYGTPEYNAMLKRAGQMAGIKSGCQTQAKLVCYMENNAKELCNKVGIDTYYSTCLNLSSFETGTAEKRDVVRALSK